MQPAEHDDAALPASPPTSAMTLAERHVLRVRLLSARMVLLQRAGRIASHHASIGEEAAIVGAALGLRERDWLFPGVRAWGAALVRGVSLIDYVNDAFGSAAARTKGHSPPDYVFSREARVAPASGLLGAHLPQAVGAAWAAKMRKDDVVTVALFDAAATTGGDFHNAMNFAGVFKAPCVFVCIHDGSQDVAKRAIAYGLARGRVDGKAPDAVLDAVRAGIRRAADAGGPTLLEAIAPRVTALSDDVLASDDVLRAAGEVGPFDASVVHELRDEIDAAVAAAETAGVPDTATIFEDVYAKKPAHLAAQAELLAARRRIGP